MSCVSQDIWHKNVTKLIINEARDDVLWCHLMGEGERIQQKTQKCVCVHFNKILNIRKFDNLSKQTIKTFSQRALLFVCLLNDYGQRVCIKVCDTFTCLFVSETFVCLC